MVGIVRPNADPFAAPPPNNTNDVGVRLKDFLESNGVLLLPPWDIGLLLMVFK